MTPLYTVLSPCLMTDLYQITMAYGFWKEGMQDLESVFHLHFRTAPFEGGFTIAAGLDNVINALLRYRFQPDDIDYLRSLSDEENEPMFSEGFLRYLENMEFSCDIFAVEEGEIVFPYEPLLRVEGPLIQCQILESLLLNIINFQTLIATKAARLCIAANGTPVVEFGFRRAQGPDGALSASRAAYIGGCAGTSNLMAGKTYGIPVKGTHAHSWIMAFDSEKEAFEAFARAMPGNSVFLVDTYLSLEGIRHAIEVGKELRRQGKPFVGIRLDSGDLAYLSIKAREMLDQAGFRETKVIAGNELNEFIIRDLIQQGSRVCVWGVGTNLITSKGHPSLDGVYKMSAIRRPKEKWKYKLKISEQMSKMTNPGILQVRRFLDEEGKYIGDAIFDLHKTPKSGDWFIIDPLDVSKKKKFPSETRHRDLLIPIFQKGRLVYESPSPKTIREKASRELSYFHAGLKRFLFPHQYPSGLEEAIYHHKMELIEQIRYRL